MVLLMVVAGTKVPLKLINFLDSIYPSINIDTAGPIAYNSSIVVNFSLFENFISSQVSQQYLQNNSVQLNNQLHQAGGKRYGKQKLISAEFNPLSGKVKTISGGKTQILITLKEPVTVDTSSGVPFIDVNNNQLGGGSASTARYTFYESTGLQMRFEFDLTASFEMYESLSGFNSDRYQYVLPTYNFSKNFDLDQINGSFNFSSSGNNTLKNTNILTSRLINNINFSSINTFSNNGIIRNFKILTKNINSIGKNSAIYKNSPQSELISAYNYDLSMPLEKKYKNSRNILTPKVSFKLSPHDMKNHTNTSRRID